MSELTLRVIRGHPYETLSTTIGMLSILLLLALLVLQEVWHAKAGPGAFRRMGAIYSITVPLFMSFCVVVSLRLLGLIRG